MICIIYDVTDITKGGGGMIIDGKEYELIIQDDEACNLCDLFPCNSELCKKSHTCAGGVWKLKPDSEWKELDINNLPPDILVGDYEFERLEYNEFNLSKKWVESSCSIIDRLANLKTNEIKYHYRKRQPEKQHEPSHEEIMGLWWENGGSLYIKVTEYDYIRSEYYAGDVWYKKSWFTNRKSATIPPETKQEDQE